MAKRKKRKSKTTWSKSGVLGVLILALLAVVAIRAVMWHPSPRHGHPVRVAVKEPPPSAPEQKPAPPAPEAAPPVPPAPPEPQPEPPVAETPPSAIPKPENPPSRAVSGKPRIAIVIDDMGLNLPGSTRAIRLPAAITLSYIPYAKNLAVQTGKAIMAGHELLLHMPMEPMGSADPGRGALLTSLPPETIAARFASALDSFSGFDGVNNHMGSKFTANEADMEIVINALQERNLFFLDSRTSPKSVGADVAARHDLPHIIRDVFLDDDMDALAVKTQLAQTEHVAQHKGYAVAIGHPHPATLAALEAWIPEAEKAGFVFVPLNSLVPGKND